jgi:hypothetical protein
MATLVLKDTQHVLLSVTPVDKHGHPADLDAPPTWASSDESILTVTAAADGLSADAATVGNIGTCQVSVQGVENGNTLTGTLDVSVVGGDAVELAVTAGTPEEIP